MYLGWKENISMCPYFSIVTGNQFDFFFFLVFLGLHPWHIEVPRLGIELELQLPDYTTVTAKPYLSIICDLPHSSWQ